MEIKVIIEAPELANAINNLAAALSKKSRDEPQKEKAPEPVPQAPEPAPVPQTQATVPTVPPTPSVPTAPAPSVPVASAPQYTIEQIMKAGATLMDAGKIEELRNLIASFGVEAVTNLKPEQLGAFATELRKLGAKI